MNKYHVSYKVYDKLLEKTVNADTPEQAEQKVKDSSNSPKTEIKVSFMYTIK